MFSETKPLRQRKSETADFSNVLISSIDTLVLLSYWKNFVGTQIVWINLINDPSVFELLMFDCLMYRGMSSVTAFRPDDGNVTS